MTQSAVPTLLRASPRETVHAQTPGWIDAALFAVIGAFLVLTVGGYGFYEPHEAHFAGVGREMVARGDWITPYLNGAPYLNKPPLFYWLIALSYTLAGSFSEWAARLPLAVVGTLGCVLSWLFARRLWGLRAGRVAAVMLLVSAGWHLYAHQLMIDLLLAVIYLASVYALWRALTEAQLWQNWALLYVLSALNMLTKGPIGVLLVLLVGVAFVVIRKRWSVLRQSRPLLGALIMVALCAPWLVLVESRNPGFLRYVLVNENVKRALDMRWPPDYDVVKVSAPMFIATALVWLAPFSLLLPQVFAFAGRGQRASDSDDARRDGVLLLLIAVAVPVVAFLPMPARLVYYNVPAIAPFAILAAGWWCSEQSTRARVGAAVALILAGAVVFSAGFWLPGILETVPDLKPAPRTIDPVGNIVFFGGAGLMAGGMLLWLRRPLLAIGALAALMSVALWTTMDGFTAFDVVRSSKRMVAEVQSAMGLEAIWISEGSKEIGASAGIAFYLSGYNRGAPRSVLIMEDDPLRPPPIFPDIKPNYLIAQPRLAELWSGAQPVLFVTDFLRKDWEKDPPRLPRDAKCIPLKNAGQRRVYANEAAWALWRRSVQN